MSPGQCGPLRPPGSRHYLLWGGLLHLLLWLYGLLVHENAAANFFPLNGADDWLYLFLGVTMIALSLLGGRNWTGSTAMRAGR